MLSAQVKNFELVNPEHNVVISPEVTSSKEDTVVASVKLKLFLKDSLDFLDRTCMCMHLPALSSCVDSFSRIRTTYLVVSVIQNS